jgi:hypothetical protein
MYATRLFEIVVALAVIGTTPASADRHGRITAPPFTPDWAAPQLIVTPDLGPGGTQVEVAIPGKSFHRGVQLYYGDRPMKILAVGKASILAVIPWRAYGSDFIYAVDYTGRARTTVPFRVARQPGRYYH